MANKEEKTNRQLERIVRGFANHRRIQILGLLEKESELSVFDIAEKLETNFKTISEHLRRLAVAGLVLKRSDSMSVRHKLTDRGKAIIKFLRGLE